MKTTLNDSPGFTALSMLVPCLLFGLFASCTAKRQAATTLERLQGRWEGFEMGREAPTGPYVKSESASKVTITITGDSLHFYRDADFWWETTFTLPEGTDLPQLHATIQRPEDSLGEVIIAFYKLEGGTLTLGGIRGQDSTAEWPKSFEAAEDTMTGGYELRKVEGTATGSG